MIKAILFDLDNTLIDRTGAAYDIYCDIVSDCLPHLDKNTVEYEAAVQRLMIWDEYGTIEKTHVFSRFCEAYQLDESLVERLSQRWSEKFGEYARSFPKSEETLSCLKERYRLGLLTNGYPHMQRKKLEKSGLEKYFELVIVSGEHGMHKPDVRIFELACEKMGLKPEEILFVGDTFAADILGALRCGMKAVWIHSDHLMRTSFDCEFRKINSIEELSELL